jgi:hypothetical protein
MDIKRAESIVRKCRPFPPKTIVRFVRSFRKGHVHFQLLVPANYSADTRWLSESGCLGVVFNRNADLSTAARFSF